MTVVDVTDLVKRYKDTAALDGVSLTLQENVIYGLLGRNGAGKTTLMSILTAQNFPSSGTVRVFGEDPYENARVLRRICFVRESQRYPDDARPSHAFRIAVGLTGAMALATLALGAGSFLTLRRAIP